MSMNPLNSLSMEYILNQEFQDSDIITVANDDELYEIVNKLDESTTVIVIQETSDNERINTEIKEKYKRLIQNRTNIDPVQGITIAVPSTSLEDQNDENNNTYNQGSETKEKRGRKRKRQVQTWKQNIRKSKRQSGKEYINSKGRTVGRRKIKNTKGCKGTCKYKCRQKISESERKKIFDSFWSLSDSGKNVFYSKTVLKKAKARHRTNKANSRRNFSFQYNFIVDSVNIRVCKEFYLSTLDISARRIQWYFDHKDPDFEDKRGKHVKFKIPEHSLQEIKDHINSFPRLESHYCRASSSREYLESNLSITKMYELYVEKCEAHNLPVQKIHIYRTIFNNEFNLAFNIPKKDRCDLCEEFDACSKTQTVKDELKAKYENHIKNKINAKAERDNDRKSQEAVVCFDMQNVITCPRANISNFFYKRKLNMYNLTAHFSLNKCAYNAVWPETMAGRGGNEISSALIVILKTIMVEFQDLQKLTLWSDSCVPQNRNSLMVTALLDFLSTSQGLTKIQHKFSEAGHSAIQEVDNIHSHIEKCLELNEIYSPLSCVRILKSVRRKNMKVIEMKESDFLNFQKASLSYHFAGVPFTKVSQLLIDSAKPCHVMYKKCHSDEAFTEVSTRKETRKGSVSSQSGIVHPKICKLGKPKKLSEEKISDLKSMIKYMPENDKKYFEKILK